MCRHLHISPQAYYRNYQYRKKVKIEEDKILDFVRRERSKNPKLGVRKLYTKFRYYYPLNKIKIGRDKFFELLRKHDLLIKRRRRYCRTTNSNHSFRVYKNLIKDRQATAPHQVWVSDITYINTYEGFLYLSLITDGYSRKIVGYEVNDTLEATGCLRALDKAIKQLSDNRYPIHHSDRGSQYCSYRYTRRLLERDLSISMTEENHCYENAKAERVNGILKDEYFLDMKFMSKSIARRACKQAIYYYNTDRPHLSLEMKTPQMVHNGVSHYSTMEVN